MFKTFPLLLAPLRDENLSFILHRMPGSSFTAYSNNLGKFIQSEETLLPSTVEMAHQFSRLWSLTALLENACFSFCHKCSTLMAKLLLNEDFLCSWFLAWTWNYMRKLKLFQIIWSEENVEGNNLKLTLCMIWYIIEFGGHRTSIYII